MKSLTTTAEKLTSVSILLLTIPFLFFVDALLQNVLNIGHTPNAWLRNFSHDWYSSLRIAAFAIIMILLPLIAVILNLLSITRVHNNKEQTGIKLINIIVVTMAGFVALLFTVVMIAD